ncbi:MAG: hypothetical protein N2045_13890 [Fimbriimonadales bacterium]|nr:hypothetical protein [Fimbriimonadales bacterium]
MCHYYPAYDIEKARCLPVRYVYELLAALPLIEYRRHVHTATLMAMVQAALAGGNVKPDDWLYPWARVDYETETAPLESPAVLRDMALARRIPPFSAAELKRWHEKYGERIHELMAILRDLEV